MFVVSVRERGKEEHRFTFRKPEVVIGRLRTNDIILPKRNISKRHGSLVLTPKGEIVLHDNGSTNGSYLNGKRVAEPVAIAPEDKLFMGDYILQAWVTEERSAIDDVMAGATVPAPGPQQVGTSELGQSEKSTLADVDAAFLDEELAKLREEYADYGPETVVISPAEVPRQPPPGLTLADTDEGEAPRGAPRRDEADTLRLREAARAAEQDAEEILEVPLIEEIEMEELAAPAVPPPRAAAPTPPPPPPPPRVAAPAALPVVTASAGEVGDEATGTTPEVDDEEDDLPAAPGAVGAAAGREDGLTALLDRHYAQLARQFDQWVSSPDARQGEARKKVREMLDGPLSRLVAPGELDSLAGQLLLEFGHLGVVASLIENPQVAEIVVASNGRLTTFDWRGKVLDTDFALSCPSACERLAGRLLGGKAAGGRGQLDDGTQIFALTRPHATASPSLRMVKQFRELTSLKRLGENGLLTVEQAAKLREAVSARRTVLLAGPRPALLSLFFQALVAELPRGCRAAISTDRISLLSVSGCLSFFDTRLLADAELTRSFEAMKFDWLAADWQSADAFVRVMNLGAALQIPLLTAVRVLRNGQLKTVLAAASEEVRVRTEQQLEMSGALVAMVGAERLEGVFLFSREGGEAGLTPVA